VGKLDSTCTAPTVLRAPANLEHLLRVGLSLPGVRLVTWTGDINWLHGLVTSTGVFAAKEREKCQPYLRVVRERVHAVGQVADVEDGHRLVRGAGGEHVLVEGVKRQAVHLRLVRLHRRQRGLAGALQVAFERRTLKPVFSLDRL
jgi:hypothetical protein